jgi:hypothetical protein
MPVAGDKIRDRAALGSCDQESSPQHDLGSVLADGGVIIGPGLHSCYRQG